MISHRRGINQTLRSSRGRSGGSFSSLDAGRVAPVDFSPRYIKGVLPHGKDFPVCGTCLKSPHFRPYMPSADIRGQSLMVQMLKKSACVLLDYRHNTEPPPQGQAHGFDGVCERARAPAQRQMFYCSLALARCEDGGGHQSRWRCPIRTEIPQSNPKGLPG